MEEVRAGGWIIPTNTLLSSPPCKDIHHIFNNVFSRHRCNGCQCVRMDHPHKHSVAGPILSLNRYIYVQNCLSSSFFMSFVLSDTFQQHVPSMFGFWFVWSSFFHLICLLSMFHLRFLLSSIYSRLCFVRYVLACSFYVLVRPLLRLQFEPSSVYN